MSSCYDHAIPHLPGCREPELEAELERLRAELRQWQLLSDDGRGVYLPDLDRLRRIEEAARRIAAPPGANDYQAMLAALRAALEEE